jgi:transcriptional regulator with XRE-family HTH domain
MVHDAQERDGQQWGRSDVEAHQHPSFYENLFKGRRAGSMNRQPGFSPHKNFADNLRTLCARHGSIAAVCRALGMNRQQFNKYLAGSTLPNAPTLEKICGFFAVEPEVLFLDPQGFRGPAPKAELDPTALVSMLPPGLLGPAFASFERMRESTLRTGCYHFYYPWPRDASKCVRAILYVYRKGGITLFTRFTKLRSHRRQRYYLSGRHDGIVLESDKAKFLLAVNCKGFGEMSLVSVGVESAASPDFMSGLALVMGAAGTPVALRATLEYRGTPAILRQALAEAAILPLSDPSIPDEVRQSVSTAPCLEPFSLMDSLPQPLRRGSAQ